MESGTVFLRYSFSFTTEMTPMVYTGTQFPQPTHFRSSICITLGTPSLLRSDRRGAGGD